MLDANGCSKAATVGSPIQPSASEASVIPSWVAEMKRVGLFKSRNAARAPRLPLAERSSFARRTETRANSDAGLTDFESVASVTSRRSGHADLCRSAFVLCASAPERILNPRSDVAFRLAADRSQLGNHQIARALEHALLAKRERLDVTQV